MHSKNALTNLKNRYRAVLKKCTLINAFGSLAVATLLLSPASSYADSLFTSTEPELNNFGTLTGDLYNIGTDQYFIGMVGYNPTTNIGYTLTNYADGVISLYSDTIAYGMYIQNEGTVDHALINHGYISVKSLESAYGMSVYIFPHGSNFTLTNTGTIYVESINDHADGMEGNTQSEDGDHILLNTGSITVKGYYSSHGMHAEADNDGNHRVTNTGSIDVTSIASFAYGMRAEAEDKDGDHIMFNSGTITVKASNVSYGMYAESEDDGDHTLTNTGSIDVTSTAHQAYGMLAEAQDDDGDHSISNSGDITVKAYSDAYGILADTEDDGDHTLTNSGSIEVTSSNDKAYGLYLNGEGTHTINNTGIISAKSLSSSAYEVYGLNTDYTVETYATSLRDWEIDDAVFAVTAGEIVNFDNSTLILRPGTIAQGFELGKEYKVANMVSNETALADSLDGTIAAGAIAQVQTEVPFLIAHLDNSELLNPKVSLTANINKDTISPTQLAKISSGNADKKIANMARKQINRMIRKRVSQASTQAMYEQGVILASNNIPYAPSYKANKWAIYLDAYTTYAKNSEYNYGTKSYGMTIGGDKAINEKLSVGFAMDFSDSTTDAQDGLTSDSTAISFLVNADYFINKNWYVSGNIALSYAENDVDYALSSMLTAKDDYSSMAFNLSASTGYLYEINANNVLVPEFGLNYFYANADDINVDFAHASMYNMSIKNDAFSALYAHLMLTWQGEYNTNYGIMKPSAGLGLRQNVTSSDFDSTVEIFGSSFASSVSDNDTSFITNAGLEWVNGNFSVGVNYDGDFGSEEVSHTASVKFRYEF